MATEDHFAQKQDIGALVRSNPAFAALLPFSALSDAEQERFLSFASVRLAAPKEVFFSEGQAASVFYLLLEGALRLIHRTDEGDQVIVLHVAPGELFGMTPAFDSESYLSTSIAVSSCLVLTWPTELWDRLSEEFPAFHSTTRKIIGARVEEMQDKIVEMATLPVEQRVARALHRLLRCHGRQTEDGIEIGFPLTRQDISEMTGTTLHSVSRCMSRWQKQGILSNTRRRVVVRKPDELPL